MLAIDTFLELRIVNCGIIKKAIFLKPLSTTRILKVTLPYIGANAKQDGCRGTICNAVCIAIRWVLSE